jgi:hypothetical protein
MAFTVLRIGTYERRKIAQRYFYYTNFRRTHASIRYWICKCTLKLLANLRKTHRSISDIIIKTRSVQNAQMINNEKLRLPKRSHRFYSRYRTVLYGELVLSMPYLWEGPECLDPFILPPKRLRYFMNI